MNGLTYGSVCSGIEAASVAWEPLGMRPLWFAEIEKFPSDVLAHHWPHVPNLGDMTAIAARIRSGETEAPDVLVGGTPCQAFSVAGVRAGLLDPRGQLTISFGDLADAIDVRRTADGKPEAIICWENVPGVLSDKTNAFGAFLGLLAGESCELQPPGGKWKSVGCVLRGKRAIAWRILDAQYFGVAQRRRRVFVVASARKGFDPTKVLFEFDSLRRDSAPSREARAETTGVAGNRTSIRSHWDGEQHPHPTLSQSHNTGGIGQSNQELFSQRGAGIVAALTANGVGTCGADDNQAQAGHLVPAQGFRMVAFGEYSDDGTASTMKARDYKDATDLAVSVVHGTQDPITADNVALPLGRNQGQENAVLTQFGTEIAGTLTARHDSSPCHDRGMNITVQAIHQNGDGELRETSVAFRDHATPINTQMATRGPDTSNSSREGVGVGEPGDPAFTLQAAHCHAVQFGMQVRRLTPTECERLQAFPDGHTNILIKGKPAPDGPRYKALGNSMATCCMKWIGQRIVAELANG